MKKRITRTISFVMAMILCILVIPAGSITLVAELVKPERLGELLRTYNVFDSSNDGIELTRKMIYDENYYDELLSQARVDLDYGAKTTSVTYSGKGMLEFAAIAGIDVSYSKNASFSLGKVFKATANSKFKVGGKYAYSVATESYFKSYQVTTTTGSRIMNDAGIDLLKAHLNPEFELALSGVSDEYTDPAAFFNAIDIQPLAVERIQLIKLPNKTEYRAGETFNPDGMMLQKVLNNGSVEDLPLDDPNLIIDTERFTAAGSQTVTVSYLNKSVSFECTVTAGIPTITVQSTGALVGEQVNITIMIENNPGIAYLLLAPVYDRSIMTVEMVENGSIIPDLDCNISYSWSAADDSYENGVLVTLTVQISPDAPIGQHSIALNLGQVYNKGQEDVWLMVTDGVINVRDFIYGDANGDGKVNGRDVLLLRKYMASYDIDLGTSSVLVCDGADANGDGIVNGKDVLLLRRYMAEFSIETNSSTVVLGPKK